MMIPTLLGISILCFLLVQLTPGGPVEQTLAMWRGASVGGETQGARTAEVTEEQLKSLKAYYGFDKPLLTRYAIWMKKILVLDFGDSYHYNQPVTELLVERMPVSLTFGLVSFFLTYFICIPLGIFKAIKHGSLFDISSSFVIFLLYSIPAFAFGVLLIVLFGGGSFWNIFPIQGMVSERFDELSALGKIKDFVHHMFLPILCYCLGSFATITMLMKNAMLEQLKQDYVITARSKGLSEWSITLQHVLRNALLPIASGLGDWLTLFFSGSLLIETIFGLQGIGRLSYESIISRDYPVVLATIMILSFLHILGRLISDFLYVWIDPRIDYSR